MTVRDHHELTEAASGGVLWEKAFLEISQNSQENTQASGVFLWIFRNF